MKLAAAVVERALDQFDARAVSETHPSQPQLVERFGDHTFFLDGNGLNIVEPAEPTEPGQATGVVVILATWADEQLSSLKVHRPQVTDVVIQLGPVGPDNEAA